MNDPEIGMRIAIECLVSTGLGIGEIDNQIVAWMRKQGQEGDWWDMPGELIDRIARSLQKAFERRYGSPDPIQPASENPDQHTEDCRANGGGVLSRDGPGSDRD